MFGENEIDKKKKKFKKGESKKSSGFGGVTGEDVVKLIAEFGNPINPQVEANRLEIENLATVVGAQPTVDGFQDAAIAANEAAATANEAAAAANAAAAAAEEANDALEEAQTDSEQALQDAAITAVTDQAAVNATNIAVNASNIADVDTALMNEITSTDAEQAAQDARLDAIEAQLPDDDSVPIALAQAAQITANSAVTTNTTQDARLDAIEAQLPDDDSVVEALAAANATAIAANASALAAEITATDGDLAAVMAAQLAQDGLIAANATALQAEIASTDAEQVAQDERLDLIEFQQADPTNLFTNGGNEIPSAYPYDTSFSWLSYDPVLQSPTQTGVTKITGPGNLTSTTFYEGDPIPVNSFDPYTSYQVSVEAKLESFSAAPGTNFRFYTGWDFRDKDGVRINWYNSQYRVNTITTLAADLNPGDTTVTIDSVEGWGVVGTVGYPVLGNYVDSSGYNWGPGGYSRNLDVGNEVTAIAGNVLTLSTPWAGPAALAGDSIRQANSAGGSYRYVPFNGSAPDSILTVDDDWVTAIDTIGPPTEYSIPNEERIGTSVMSGATSMTPVLLTRPTDLVADYSLCIGKWDVKSVTERPQLARYAKPGASRRQYLTEGQATDEGLNTTYGESNQNGSSNYSRTDPTRVAPGMHVDETGRLLKWKMHCIKNSASSWGFTVRLWKQSKNVGAATADNTLLDTFTYPAGDASTNNILLTLDAGYNVEEDDIIFATFQKNGTVGNATVYLYVKSESYLFEGGRL